MAAGVSMQSDRVEEFRKAFQAAVRSQLEGDSPEAELEISLWLKLSDISESLIEKQERLCPFGQQNPQPIYGMREVILGKRPQIFSERHLRLNIPGHSESLPAVGWKMANHIPPHDKPIDLAFRLGWNYWNGRRLPQAELIDWRPTII